MTRRRRERRSGQEVEEDEAVVGCLDVLRGASALLARHKAEVAGLLSRRAEKGREPLERLVSDLTEVLSTASTSNGGGSGGRQGQEQEENDTGSEAATGRGAGGGGCAVKKSGVKRAKAQQAATAGSEQQQQLAAASSSSSSSAVAACEGREALAIPELLEHVMSFAEDEELLGRLSLVCRLWRVVSEGERLSMRVLERRMPSALLGGEESLRARLGRSARRCLLVHNALATSGRLMCRMPQLHVGQALTMMVEIFYEETALCVIQGDCSSLDLDEKQLLLFSHLASSEVKPFSLASLGHGTVHDVFSSGCLSVRFLVMDLATGVTASLFSDFFCSEGEPPEPEGESARLVYTTGPVPVTSMTYAGPPLQAKLALSIYPCEKPGQDDHADLLTQRERMWRFDGHPELRLIGDSAIYGERFVRTRLAEEAMAAKHHGSR